MALPRRRRLFLIVSLFELWGAFAAAGAPHPACSASASRCSFPSSRSSACPGRRGRRRLRRLERNAEHQAPARDLLRRQARHHAARRGHAALARASRRLGAAGCETETALAGSAHRPKRPLCAPRRAAAFAVRRSRSPAGRPWDRIRQAFTPGAAHRERRCCASMPGSRRRSIPALRPSCLPTAASRSAPARRASARCRCRSGAS